MSGVEFDQVYLSFFISMLSSLHLISTLLLRWGALYCLSSPLLWVRGLLSTVLRQYESVWLSSIVVVLP